MDKFNISFFTVGVGIYFIVVGILYYIIFNKHHRRNKVELYELIRLVSKFYVTVTISIGIIFIGIKMLIDTNEYKDTRSDVIKGIALAIVIISAVIINFIFYIKNSLKDFNFEERQIERKKELKIGETLELIFFIIFLFMPIWKIPYFINIFEDKKFFIISIGKSIFISLCALFLLYKLNPLKIKNKVKKLFKNKL